MRYVSYQDTIKGFKGDCAPAVLAPHVVSRSNSSDSEYFIFPPHFGAWLNSRVSVSCLRFFRCGEATMRSKQLLAVLAILSVCIAAAGRVQSQTPAPPPLSPGDKAIVKAFEKRAKDYSKMREALEEKMPKLSKEAKPEEIENHKKQFQDRVRAARASAKRGDVFSPEATTVIRRMIKEEFKGRERVELRDTVLRESDTKAVPLRVNYPYPESQELLEMPPTLLLRLPQLPKQLRYRFVSRSLLLVDRENGLIVDYMTNALP